MNSSLPPKPRPRLSVADMRGIAQLATEATVGVARIVEGVHQSVWGTLGVPGGKSPGQTRGVTGLVYRTVNDVVRLLVELAIEHAHATYPTFAVTPATKRTLTRIYRGFVATLGAILAEERAEHAVREAVARHATYHLSGLKALFLSAKTREASR